MLSRSKLERELVAMRVAIRLARRVQPACPEPVSEEEASLVVACRASTRKLGLSK